jgi:hypothetical protein
MIGFPSYIKKSVLGISGHCGTEIPWSPKGWTVLGDNPEYSKVPEGKKYTQYDTVPHSQSEIPFFS